jgi:hypothetical protein
MREQVYEEYNTGWRSTLAAAQELVAGGDRNLARILNLLQKPTQPNSNGDLLNRFGFRICGQQVKGISDHLYEAPLFELQLQREISKTIEPNTQTVVELGSGYSKNLFRIWLNGGPSDAVYVGAEYTDAGRRCGEFLATLEPQIKYRAVPFDFYKLNLVTLDHHAKTYVFTCYAVEQIPEVTFDMLEAIIRIPGVYRVVHIEPVGWQRKLLTFPWTSKRALHLETRKSALECQYNANLLEALQTLERQKKIEIEKIKFDFLAHRPNLAGTVIMWRPTNRTSHI